MLKESLTIHDILQVVINSSVTVDCSVYGTPQPTVVWFKDGQLLPLHLDPRISTISSGEILQILSVKTDDEGLYMCRASNVAGELDRSVKLEVLSK